MNETFASFQTWLPLAQGQRGADSSFIIHHSSFIIHHSSFSKKLAWVPMVLSMEPGSIQKPVVSSCMVPKSKSRLRRKTSYSTQVCKKIVLERVQADDGIGQVTGGRSSKLTLILVRGDWFFETEPIDFDLFDLDLNRTSIQFKQNFVAIDVTQNFPQIPFDFIFKSVKLPPGLLVGDQGFTIGIPFGQANDGSVEAEPGSQLSVFGAEFNRIIADRANLSFENQIELRFELVGDKFNLPPVVDQSGPGVHPVAVASGERSR